MGTLYFNYASNIRFRLLFSSIIPCTMRAVLSKLKSFTNNLFTKHLFLTNTAVGIIFIGAGDVIQQNIEKRMYEGKKYEKKRTGNMMLAGSTFGSIGHFWYKFLDTKFPGQTIKSVSKKLLAEMVVGPPIFFCFFLGIGYLEGKPIRNSVEEFKKNIIIICTADWAIYAPLQAVNFFYVPPKYRVLYVCVLCLVYDVFLSYILHKEDNEKLTLQKKE